MQSIGGRGGSAGNVTGLFTFAADGGSGGTGGLLNVTSGGSITTEGNGSAGIELQSIGGAGGSGGSSFGLFYSNGGSGGSAGAGGGIVVTTASSSSITTLGNSSPGIIAQTIGGTGGSGGSSGGIVTIGGYASGTASGGDISIVHGGDISTGESPSGEADSSTTACAVGCSYGILAQSIGGGGGNGGASAGWFSIGGAADGGGGGGDIDVTTSGSVTTALSNSTGILAQSIGGGGGNGGASVSGGAFGSLSIGGSGGNGGVGGAVTVTTTDSASFVTSGDGSHGVHAQSVGGGGGNAGFSVAVAAGAVLPTASVSLGGSGGSGGDASAVKVVSSENSSVSTQGEGAHGIFAQSIGGGGGNGGFAVSLAGGTSGAVSIGIGGSGGSGGSGSLARITNASSVSTTGDNSSAVISQSIGGGGGNGGFSISTSASSSVAGISVGVGGSGGSGNNAGSATLINSGALTTVGDLSPGLVAQSIGGGGGNGGFSIAGTLTVNTPAAALSVGGSGGTAGSGGSTTVDNRAAIATVGEDSPGILAQTIGGGGGNGGLSIAGTITAGASVSGSGAIGGSGGVGGAGGDANVFNESAIATSGERSSAIQVQSVGGGGGSGGVAVSGSVGISGTSSLALSIGGAGSGGSGTGASSAIATTSGDLSTLGDLSPALVVQSIGGGGGAGGTSITGTVSSSSTKSLSASIGGGGGSSGAGSLARVTVNSDISTGGQQSDGILVQSIGGSGGNGGTAVAGNLTTSKSTQIGLGIGGGAGNAGAGGTVSVNETSLSDGLSHDITVTGDGSRGIVAQSIGGGGGNGGMAVTGNLNTAKTTKTLNVTVGGTGGAGGAGGDVAITHIGAISTGTSGTQSLTELNYEYGILAQSISGGGGNGGLAVSGSTNKGNRSLSLSIGGAGGSGVSSGDVAVTKSGSIATHSPFSHGIFAQSIAGGGGNGGGTTTYQRRNSDTEAKSFTLSIGGSGGTSNAGGDVTIDNSASIVASGLGAQGLVAQSIGGGGGNGGSNVFQSNQDSGTSGVLTVGIGGGSGAGGGGGDVSVLSSGAIVTGTEGSNSDDLASNTATGYGIFAQSVSSGGGNGGSGISGAVETSGDKSLVVGVGGAGSGSADGGTVFVQSLAGGSVTTFDDGSHGVLAQSVAGGGGNGAAGIDGDVSNGSTNALTVGIGGSAGPGGAGGGVTIELNDDVTVQGDGAKAIVAQSIGGGGGSGGIGIEGDLEGSDDSETNQLSIGVGGSGGSGGAGGTVQVTMNADISTGVDGDSLVSTTGAMDGIFAQSIAGGGGDASAGIAGDVTNSSESKAITLGISLSGGTSKSGGAVTVTSSGSSIAVSGEGSRGIVAQSIGGAGGEGSVGIEGSIESADSASSTTQLDLGIGGSGGGGGSGGTVTVTNTAAITTNVTDLGGFTDNHGILAQSLGGGGGNGGVGISGDVTNAEESKALTIGIGGSSDSGGDGGSVTVTNKINGIIATSGSGSYGIFAQSLGGGGGTGGIGVEGDVEGDEDASSVTQLEFGLGGSGGSGGDGGQVFISNKASISSSLDVNGEGAQMHGIFAQSIGGGGGSGDVGVGGDITGSEDSKALTLAIGGSGGSGGSAAAGETGTVGSAGVGVSNSGAVTVVGDGSKGIFAQSIGGGGGDGSAGLSGTVDSGDGSAVTLSVGAQGGSGGDGGVVKINNRGTITTGSAATTSDTAITEAHGIFAQSIGGGGGTGSLTGSLLFGSSATSGSEKGLAVTLGGSAGAGDGSNVTIFNGVLDNGKTFANSITTYNANSHGLFAQSVGGGGGSAGDLGGISTDSDTDGWLVAASFGASSGNDGDGGDVEIQALGEDINTLGLGSHGIFAQSIGGGGGDGANAASSSETSDATLALNFGASDGSSGSGGAVTVDSTSAVTTLGKGAVGIFAQSIGGGGGRGANEANGLSGTLTLGGLGSASGAGGAVTVAISGDGVVTKGRRAHGVVAQSIGGGGGYAGRPIFGSRALYGSGLDFGADGTASGSGGAVVVNLTESGFSSGSGIVTNGKFSAGVFAQSVGGGGGVAGALDGSTNGATIGSGSGSGAGGKVQVNLYDASVIANGGSSFGIFAQSAGGSGSSVSSADKVSINLSTGTIQATGAGSTGIYAQSSGQGRGNVVVEIGSIALVSGGAVSSSSSAGGAAIFIKDGVDNSVINNGFVQSSVGPSGRAIVSEGVGTTSVTNRGVITGQVLLNGSASSSAPAAVAASSQSRFVNAANGTLFTSRIVAEETVNRGVIHVGNPDEVATLRVQGDYTQPAGGVLAVDVIPSNAEKGLPVTDTLIVQGNSNVEGVVEITLLSTEQASDGEITAEIIRTVEDPDAPLGATGNASIDLQVAPSVVAQYALSKNAANDAFLSFDIDYANPTAAAQMSNNTFNAARGFNSLARAGGVSDSLANDLIAFTDPEAYATVMDSLNPEVFVNNQITTLRSNYLFNNQMTNCENHASAYRSNDLKHCVFVSADGNRVNRSTNASNEGFHSTWWQVTLGGETALNQDWSIGGALAYQSRNQTTDSHNNSSSDGDGVLAGLYATRFLGPVELTGSVSTGFGWFDTTRSPFNLDEATGSQSIWTVSTRIGAAYQYDHEIFYARPRLDFGFDFVDGSSFTEGGDNPFRLSVEGDGDAFFTLQPSVEVGANIQTDQGFLLRPRLSVGVVQFLGNDSASMSSRYVAGSNSIPAFRTSTDLGSTQVELGGGLDLVAANNMTLRAEAFGSLNSVYSSYGGGLAAVIPF